MTTDPQPHARAFDLPGWPCPPRVRDIAHVKDSWGGVPVRLARNDPESSGVVQDELGRLWANGDQVPVADVPAEFNTGLVGAVLFWTEQGLGVYVSPDRYKHLPSLNTFHMSPDRWMPIVAVAERVPDVVHQLTPRTP